MTIATQILDTSASAVYTSSGNTAVTFLSICNYSSNTVTVDVYVVPSSGSASSANQVYSSLQLTPDDTYQLYLGGEKLLLANGDTIQMAASAAFSVTAVTSYTSI